MFVVLATFGTSVVYWIYARAQEFVDVSVLSMVLCAIPLFAVLFAYVLLHEILTPDLVAGGIIITAGIVVIATERVKKRTSEQTEVFEDPGPY